MSTPHIIVLTHSISSALTCCGRVSAVGKMEEWMDSWRDQGRPPVTVTDSMCRDSVNRDDQSDQEDS
ncbi:uncharacterized protein BO72DRAFT_447438 [Aspergillus fijiensis CBS 313.89]|uniref:Uncharacterized protein n=1 Tax=Aspergillus fijiensis CBS 313.89 TaxID=1448319 RepID=A0A8G1RSP7_9EURO|nr:uncharacterized protein BO72DRAFT_447438 [Aspergillus fijiensis CBS 313.89]RAK77982.1 hypothetical protein BO72DRAFT_447438 [Aspergillus fijiensis CBS 313.89]